MEDPAAQPVHQLLNVGDLLPLLHLNSDLSLYQELSVPCFRPVGVLRSVMGGYYVLGPGE